MYIVRTASCGGVKGPPVTPTGTSSVPCCFYRGADKSLTQPWNETSYSDKDLQYYTKTNGVQTAGIYCCYLYAVSIGIVL